LLPSCELWKYTPVEVYSLTQAVKVIYTKATELSDLAHSSGRLR
jgi:hypothetical protein